MHEEEMHKSFTLQMKRSDEQEEKRITSLEKSEILTAMDGFGIEVHR
jgi:hypothetical protein